MASKRNLKKDINYLASELVAECYMKQVLTDANEQALAEIMVEIISYRNQLIYQANNPQGVHQPKEVKKYYKALATEMLEKLNGIIQKINDVK